MASWCFPQRLHFSLTLHLLETCPSLKQWKHAFRFLREVRFCPIDQSLALKHLDPSCFPSHQTHSNVDSQLISSAAVGIPVSCLLTNVLLRLARESALCVDLLVVISPKPSVAKLILYSFSTSFRRNYMRFFKRTFNVLSPLFRPSVEKSPLSILLYDDLFHTRINFSGRHDSISGKIMAALLLDVIPNDSRVLSCVSSLSYNRDTSNFCSATELLTTNFSNRDFDL